MRSLPLAGLGAALTVALSGCGGATTSGTPIVATPNSGPVIYGANALAASTGAAVQGETSGMVLTDGSGTGVITGAVGYKTDSGAGPLPAYASTFDAGIPLGFSANGNYFNSTSGQALTTSYAGSLIFGAYISTGIQNGDKVDLDTNSVVLTSLEDPAFSQKLTFDPNFGRGVLSQAQYKTASFAMPGFLKTTGLHDLHTVIADVAGQKSETDFNVLALAPTDSAVVMQVLSKDASGYFTVAVPGATATITGALPNVPAYKAAGAPATLSSTTSYSDSQGVVILFAAPGDQTVTVSATVAGKAVSATVPVTLTGGTADTTDAANVQ